MTSDKAILNKVFAEKRTLLLGLTLLLCVGFAATSLVSFFISRQSIRHEIVTNELPLTTDNIYSEIQKDLIQPVLVSSMMARNTFLRDWMIGGELETDRIVRYLKEVQQKYGAVTSFLVSEKSRKYYYEEGILKQVSERDPIDVWYFRSRSMATPYEMNLDMAEAHQNTLTLFVNYQVHDYQRRLIGVAGVGLPLNQVRDLIEQYQIRYRRIVYMSDSQGHLILHSNGFPAGETSLKTIPGLGEQVDGILRQQQGDYQYVRDGHTHLVNMRFIPELNWYLFVEKIEDEAYADIYRTLLMNLGICAGITFIVALLFNLSINRHQARLKQAVESHTAELNEALAATHAANRTKTQMLAYISHDLRAPLGNITHYLHRLNTDGGDNIRQYHASIEQSIVQQLQLIDDLVEYARGELDHLELLPVPTYLHSFLHDISRQAQLLAAVQENGFALVLSGAPAPVLVLDAKRLRQVLLNLLSNAAKFTSGGEIRLQVLALQEPGIQQVRLQFAVTDTGPGIPKEDQPRIFQPFERRKSQRQGSGLGLNIADQIVRKMGSELTVDSAPGLGSTFGFEITLDVAQESDVLQPVQALAFPEPFGANMRIMIVENNPNVRDSLYEVLLLADFDVFTATDVTAALAQDAQGRFDIVLSDQPDAWLLLQELHARHPEHPPSVVLHAAVPPQRPKHFPAELNFAEVLFKPVSPENLLQALHSKLGNLSPNAFKRESAKQQPIDASEIT